MNPPKNSIATEAAFLVASLCFAGAAFAAPAAGTVTQLSGPLFAQKADGRTKVLAGGSVVDVGDTLLTGKDTYAEVRFADSGTVTLQSDTRLAIEAFAFDKARAAGDRAELKLVDGGVKVVSGVIGARSPGRHILKTAFGAIEVREAIFIVQYAAGADGPVAALARIHLAALSLPVLAGGTLSDVSAEPLIVAQLTPPASPGLAPGLYVHVIDGIINLSNNGGSQSFAAGQFGYTASFIKPPVVVPNNPGIQFTPPPAFSTQTHSTGSTTGNGNSGSVDCEVR
jgi:hypothetical protein